MGRNIVITPNRSSTGSTQQPNISFSGLSAGTISLLVEDDGSLVYDGVNGSLFSISDNKDGLLHSVNDVSGLPIFQVWDDNKVVLGVFNNPALTISGSVAFVGPTATTASILHISGGSITYKDGNQGANKVLVSDTNGIASWQTLSSTAFTGGTVSGATNFTGGLTGNTISATTYLNLPLDLRLTGGTYSNGTILFTNNSGQTFNVTGLTTTDTFVTGFTYSNNTFTISQNQGKTALTATINTVTGLTVSGNIIVTGGTVGIGTSSPQDTLHIKGNDNVLTLEGTDHVYMNFYPKGYSAGRKGWFGYPNSGDTNLSICNQTNSGLMFRTNDTDRMFITSGGTVGIGNGSPTQLLDVEKAITGVSARFRGSVEVGDFSGNDAQIQIGQSRTAIGNAFLDLIGDTTNPFYGLRLIRWGAINGANAISQLTHKGTGALEIVTEGAAPIDLKTTSTSRLYINSAGNVGINTTSFGTESFDVNGTSRLRGIVSVGDKTSGTTGIEIGGGRTANGFAYLDLIGDTTNPDYGLRLIRNSGGTNTNSILSHRGTGTLSIGAQDAGSLQFVTTDSARIFITSTGGTGIGTITPTELLDVARPITGISARFRGSVDVGDLGGNDAQIRIGQGRTINGNAFLDLIGDPINAFYGLRLIRWSATTANALSQLTHKGTGALEIVTEGAAPIDLRTNVTSRLYITSGGNVGIGTITPSEKLHVSGNAIISTGGTGSRLGINTIPSYTIDVLGDSSRFFMLPYTSSTFVGARQMLFTGETNTSPQYAISDGVSDIGIGVRGSTTTSTTYMNSLGVVKDTFIAVSAAANGLNIMNFAGSGTQDFIRFYAGQDANAANTADIHIQGSGSTRGNVGIGTETPTAKLHVVKSNSYLTFDQTTAGGNLSVIGTNTQLVTINVGDGTTGVNIGHRGTSDTTYPGYGAQNDDHLYSGYDSNGLNIIKGRQAPTSTQDYIRFYVGQNADGNTADMHMQGENSSPSLRGYIGMGTITPASKLHVKSNGGLFNLEGTDHCYIQFYPDGFSTGAVDNNRKAYIGFASSGSTDVTIANQDTTSFAGIVFRTSGSDRLYISSSGSSGNVGIGITAPTQKLDVNGNARIRSVGTASLGNVSLYITSTGELSTSASDERLKKDVITIDSALDKVKNLRGVYYKWRTGDTENHVGFIAQEVNNIVPELTYVNSGTSENYMGVHYSEMTALLVESIKEMSKTIDELKEEIRILKNK